MEGMRGDRWEMKWIVTGENSKTYLPTRSPVVLRQFVILDGELISLRILVP
jgi:hypothetical protein